MIKGLYPEGVLSPDDKRISAQSLLFGHRIKPEQTLYEYLIEFLIVANSHKKIEKGSSDIVLTDMFPISNELNNHALTYMPKSNMGLKRFIFFDNSRIDTRAIVDKEAYKACLELIKKQIDNENSSLDSKACIFILQSILYGFSVENGGRSWFNKNLLPISKEVLFPESLGIQKYRKNVNLGDPNISDCTALTIISCNENKLTSLDLSNDTALESLECSTNQLTSLDVSDCTALTKLYCNSNQLTSLDVSNNKALTKLNCGGNQLTVLDVSNNTALTGLGCFNNKLTALDVSSCTALEVLLCNVNPLKSLDLSKNTALTKVSCGYTNLTSLDLSGNVNILTVICDHNEYTLSSTSLDELKQYGFDPAKASNWSGASYNAATNSLVNVTSEYVSYTYDLGNGFTETFTLIVTIPKVPAKPTNVTATPGDKQVALSWTAAEGATSYTIYKYENGKYAKINSTASTTYTVTGLTNGTTYKFLVRAFNATGGNAFTTADLVSATPKAAVPAKPTNVKATAGDKQVTLSWSAATGATSYTIYKYENGKYVKINSTASTTYTVTGLTNGTTYKFLVRAFNTAGGNSFTTADLVSATPKAAAATVPAKPTVTANVQDKVVTFSWNAVAGATYYKLYNYSDGKYGLIATVTDTTYRLRYLKNGTTYKVLVRAFNDKGGSSFTTADLISVTPKAATAVPTAPSVKASVSGGNVNLTWAHVPTAFSYTIYKYENGTYTKLGATCDNYFTVKGLAAGKTYSILVRAFNSKGGHKVTSGDRVSVTL